MTEGQGRRLNPSDASPFMLAGNAHVTLVSSKTGARFTFKVSKCDKPNDDRARWFVGLLSGADNTSDYTFMGSLVAAGEHGEGRVLYIHGFRSSISKDAPSAKAFAWTWERIAAGTLKDEVEVWHEGRCGRCGRLLTVPESIERGLGPECAGK